MDEIYKNLDLNNLPNEIWLPIEGYEDKYQVSSLGRIKSLKNNHNNPREKILRQGKNKEGYLFVSLCKDGKIKNLKVHRLVATAFIDNHSNLPCVNHKNEIKTDNRVENLEPCDHKYNLNYKNTQARRVASTDYKAIAEKQRNDPNKSRQVYQYSLDGTLVTIWESTQECQRNGYSSGNVSQCCRNCFNREGNNVYKGYIWSYTEL